MNYLVVSILILICFVFIGKYLKTYDNFENKKKVCYITAIYGNYEQTCKKFSKQTIDSDFICFTDNEYIQNNGWIIDTTPYHELNNSLDNGEYHNSIKNNKHTFNIAKYYKQSFNHIPSLKDYDIIIWLDGTIEIIDENTSKYISLLLDQHKIIGWNHEHRNGIIKKEVDASNMERYTSTFWNNQPQHYQDIYKQYEQYTNEGYNDNYFKSQNHPSQHYGVWITCFVAFSNKDPDIERFLNEWYLQTLKYTTQDQISFPYVCWKTKINPYTLPDNTIKGNSPHKETQLYIKHSHNK